MVAHVLAILLAIIPVVETGIGNGALERFEFRETHMGSEFKLVVYCNDEGVASQAARAAFDRIAFLDQKLSDYRVDSELMRLCDQAGGEPVVVSPDLFEVLRRSKELSERTAGAFDVTINPVVKLWRRARRDHQLPSREQLEAAIGRVGWERMSLDAEARTVQLADKGMRLDVGGIAKGYASDAALAVLREQGISRALVAGAGDIVVGDPPPDQEGWLIGIAPLDSARQPERFLRLKNQAVSTSGDAERYVEIDGIRYSHIVDPRSGLGLTGRSSVTVVAPNGTSSDSLATAISVLGPERGLELAEKTEGVEAMIVLAPTVEDEWSILRTNGFDALESLGPGNEEMSAPRLGGPES